MADRQPPRVVAVLGKGGAGKTMVSALLARVLCAEGRAPLLIDADPTGGLTYALGVTPRTTIGQLREQVIDEARADAGREEIARSVDWRLLEALQEQRGFSLLAMGHSATRGCYCPLNSLLRAAIGRLAAAFDFVVVDAEAGIEQVNRQVMSQVEIPLIVSDPSLRGLRAAGLIAELLPRRTAGARRGGLLLNRDDDAAAVEAPAELELWGVLPLDEQVAAFDRQGRSLLELPDDNPVLLRLGRLLRRRLLGEQR